MLSRRSALRLGMTSAIAGVVGSTGWWSQALSSTTGMQESRLVTPPIPFSTPLTVPPTLKPYLRTASTDYYAVVIGEAQREILPGSVTEVLTYNGSFPGPTIKTRSGRNVVVQQINALNRAASTHLHGAPNPAEYDGASMDTVPPGGLKTYRYANAQPSATLWLHDHAHHLESENVYRGLSSVYVVGDNQEDSLNLPSGKYDIPLVVRDAQFDQRGQLIYTMDAAETRSTILVNGRPWPSLKVEGRKYRFRLVNSSNLRIFVLRLSGGGMLTQIGSDGGLLERPDTRPVVVLSPGERADVVIDFSKFAPGTRLVLENLIGPGPVEQVGKVMCFDVGALAADTSVVPAVLTALPPLAKPTVQRQFTLKMDETGGGAQGYINDKVFDPARIDTTVEWGSTEVWTVTNSSTMLPHNFHTHLVQFRVLERNGQPPFAAESGRKDTVLLFPGETVKLHLTFDSHRGVFPYHCHMIDHSAMGMMAQLRVV